MIENPAIRRGGLDILKLCPQILCADNHLRDVVELDLAAYVRLGFYELGAARREINLTVTERVTVDMAVAIGPGSYGGEANETASGEGGLCGARAERCGLTLEPGDYRITCGYNEETDLTALSNGASLLYAEAGETPPAGTGTEGSSVSGLPGSDGYMLDLQPGKFNFGVNENVRDTGAGIGAGGGGEGNQYREIPVRPSMRRGLGGGVFFYVRL